MQLVQLVNKAYGEAQVLLVNKDSKVELVLLEQMVNKVSKEVLVQLVQVDPKDSKEELVQQV